jgi:hypothetical protein
MLHQDWMTMKYYIKVCGFWVRVPFRVMASVPRSVEVKVNGPYAMGLNALMRAGRLIKE